MLGKSGSQTPSPSWPSDEASETSPLGGVFGAEDAASDKEVYFDLLHVLVTSTHTLTFTEFGEIDFDDALELATEVSTRVERDHR